MDKIFWKDNSIVKIGRIVDGELDLARTDFNMIRDRTGNELVMGKVIVHKFTYTTPLWGDGTPMPTKGQADLAKDQE